MTADDGRSVLLNYKQLHEIGAPMVIVGSWATTTYPGAYFQASTSYADFATTGNHLKSLSAFFKPTAGGVTPGPIVSSLTRGGSNFVGWVLMYEPSTNILDFYICTGIGAGTLILSSPGALTPGNWYHAAVTWDGTTWTLYLNGVAVATVSGFDGTFHRQSVLTLGAGTIYRNNSFPRVRGKLASGARSTRSTATRSR